MKLVEIEIENFRSIKNCHIRFDEIAAIVGENNAGKSALLRAINSVFNWDEEKVYFADNTHQYAPRTVTRIKLSFDDVPNKNTYHGKTLNNHLVLSFSYIYSNSSRKKSLKCITNSGDVQVEDQFMQELKEDIDYVYIPAYRGTEDLIWSSNSIFQRVINAYANKHTQSRDNLSAQVARAADSLKKSVFSKIERELNTNGLLNGEKRYSLDFLDGLDYTLFLNKAGLNISEYSHKLPVTEYGSGIQSISVIALYRALAKVTDVNVILGLEEPETNLHPHAQKKLIASIKGNRQEREVQAIISTHSTVIVDELNHEDIILARRISDKKRGYCTSYAQIEQNFWDTNSLSEYKHNKFFRYRNSDFFFAKYVVVVESSTDAQVMEELLRPLVGEKLFYISILNLDGVKNIKYPYFLLKSLGIPFSMVVDMDFFTAYKNDKLEASRNPETFLPEYKNVFNERHPVIKDIWNNSDQKSALTVAVAKSYSAVFEECKKYSIFPMQYCLEMDLVANSASKTSYCLHMNVPNDGNANHTLLIDKKDAIKDPEVVLKVVKDLQPVQYPYSYKRIRKAIAEEISNLF